MRGLGLLPLALTLAMGLVGCGGQEAGTTGDSDMVPPTNPAPGNPAPGEAETETSE